MLGTAETSNIAKTPLQGFLRWNMDDCRNGICPIRMCEATDFAIKNQRKRFSDWRRLFLGWQKLLLEQGEMPLLGQDRRNATVDEWAKQFQIIFAIHCTLIKFLHPSKAKRKRMRKNPCSYLTLKISTTLTDYRAVTSSIERFRCKLRRYRSLVRCQRWWRKQLVA